MLISPAVEIGKIKCSVHLYSSPCLSGNILFGIPCGFDKFHSNVFSQCAFSNFEDVCNNCNIDKYNLLCDFEFDGF